MSFQVGAVQKQQTFLHNDTFNLSTVLQQRGGWVEVLVVGGGGGGSGYSVADGNTGCAGGGGQVIRKIVQVFESSVPITVGAGGMGASGMPEDGKASSFGSYVTAAGGFGGYLNPPTMHYGNCGDNTGGTAFGILSQATGTAYSNGAGGGAGGAANGSHGGPGLYGYGGGGGGSNPQGVLGLPGSCGGGRGGGGSVIAGASVNGFAANPNSGSGGGGGGPGNNSVGGNGGSGIVIVTWWE